MFLRDFLFLTALLFPIVHNSCGAEQNKPQYFGAIRIASQSTDIYRQYYPFHSGDSFALEKHVHGIEKLRAQLNDQGYLGAQITDTLVSHESNQAVDVAIALEKGQRYKIEGLLIQVEESYPEITERLTHQLHKKLSGKRYQRSLVQDVIAQFKKQLLYDGYCSAQVTYSLKPDAQKATVTILISIKLNKRTQYIFHGNRFFTDGQIFETVFAGQSFWLLPTDVLRQEIEDAYRQKGFWDIVINSSKQGDATHFYIKEGDRARIKNVTINGVQNYSSGQLVAQFFGNVLKSRFFNEAMRDEALEKMILFYARNGFWDATVLDTQYIKRANSFYDLIITLDEGIQRFLSEARIWEFPHLSKTWPFRIAKKPIPFNKSLLYEQYYWLNTNFTDHGYTIIKSDPIIDEIKPNHYRVTWHIKREQEQARFGKTTIIKTGRIPIAFIERELAYTPSTAWDTKKVDASIARLRNLQIFKTVEYTICPDGKKRDITITLQEDDPFELRARLGLQQVSKNKSFDTGTSFKAGGSFIWKNPINHAGQFLIDGDITRFDRNFLAHYSVPWIFNRRIATDIHVYSNRQNNPPFIEVDSKLYETRIDGVGIDFEKKFGVVNWGLSTGFEWQGVFQGDDIDCDIAQALDFDRELLDRRFLYFYFSPHCAIRWLDDELDPHKGFITSISVKGMLNNDDKERLSFAKILVEQSFFMPIVDPVVLAVRFRFGHITSQAFRCILPSERFFLGGPNTVRGYEPDFMPPLGECIQDECSICIPQGGKTMVNANFELRFPIYKWLHGVIFNDLGFLCKDECLPDRPLGATGLGLRLKSPLGIVRFDVGWKWNPSTLQLRRTGAEVSQTPLAWYLTVGHAF